VVCPCPSALLKSVPPSSIGSQRLHVQFTTQSETPLRKRVRTALCAAIEAVLTCALTGIPHGNLSSQPQGPCRRHARFETVITIQAHFWALGRSQAKYIV
jgi:hypothetical protein